MLDDDILYEMCGDRPDLCLFLNSGIHYFDKFNEKMEIMKPLGLGGFEDFRGVNNYRFITDGELRFTPIPTSKEVGKVKTT